MRGSTYNTLVLTSDDVNGLWDFIKRIHPYDRSAFVFLERFLRKSGKRELANRVRYKWNLIEGKRLKFFSVNCFKWLWDRLLRFTTGYGTKMLRLTIGVILLFLGSERFDVEILRLVLRSLAVFGAAVLGDSMRRRLMPE